jgi:hypothetical protein
MPEPLDGCSPDAVPVTISMRNNGSNTINNFIASYQAIGGSVVNEPVSTTWLSGDTLDYTFATLYDPNMQPWNPDSTITIRAWIDITNDTYPVNDTIEKTVEFLYSPPDPVVTNYYIPYGSSVTLSIVSPDSLEWYSVPTGGLPIGHGTYTTPALFDTTVYYVQATTDAPGFMIDNLFATGYAVVDHDAITGDDRGGIAVTESYYYYNGDGSAVRYNMPDLTNGTAVTRQDGIFSDLSGTGTLYTIWNGSASPVGTSLSSAYVVNSVRTLNIDGSLGSTIIPLSQNITMGSGSGSGIFSGGSFVILYNNTTGSPANTWYRIDLPSGVVTVLGTYTFSATSTENWARWGIAELIGDDYCVTYVASSTQINRLNLTTGAVTSVGTYSSLSDMACITIAPWYDRWYFHHEGGSQFGGSSETAGYADAALTLNQGCTSARVPDTVFTSTAPACEVGIEVLYSPVSGIELTANEIVRVRVKNYGTSPASNIPISFTINGGAPVTETIVGPIAPGDTVQYTFTAHANLQSLGTYDFDVFTSLGCDTIQTNDTVTTSIVNNPMVYCNAIPYYTNSEEIFSVTFNGVTNAYDCFTVAPGPGSVLNRYSNFTTLPPLTIFARGNDVSFVIEQDECDGPTYNYNGCAIWVDYNRDADFLDAGEQVFVENMTYIGPRMITGSFTIPVTASLGVTSMRIIVAEGYSGSSLQPCMTYYYGETEDYRVVINPQIPHDAGVTTFLRPLAVEAEGASVPVNVMVKNFGTDVITNAMNMTVAYSYNGGPVQSITWAGGNIASLASDTAFLPNITIAPGYNDICAWTVLAGDSNTFNDTLCFSFYGTPNFDAGVTGFMQPSSLNGIEGALQTVQVTIKNFGTNTLTSIPVAYSVNGTQIASQTWTGSLASGASTNVLFTTQYTTPAQQYDLCAYTGLVPDGDHTNDTTCITPYGLFTSTPPYYDNFDGAVLWSQADNGLGTMWEHGIPAYGATNTAHSTPYAWDVNLNAVYTPSCLAALYTQNFNFTGISNAKLTCWVNVDVETCCDGLTLQYSTDGSLTWQTLGIVNDPNGVNWYTTTTGGYPSWVSTGGWIKVEYPLNAVNNLPTVRFRFAFHADGSVEYSGASVDDFSITVPSPIDAGVELIKSPTVQAPSGTMKQVKVLVRNFGMDTLTSIPLAYTVNGGTPVHATWVGQLYPNDTITYTFATQFSVPGGVFDLCSYTEVPGDGDFLNDTSCRSITGVVTFIVPWSDDMEGTVYWFDDGGNASWEWGVPASTTINTAHSPTHCWKTNLDGFYMNSSNDFLYTPYFLFTQVNDATLDFWHWYQTETNVDGGKIEYSLNGGSTWITLGYVGDPAATNWYSYNIGGSPYWSGNSGGWIHSTYNLSTIPSIVNATNPVQFRYRFMSSASNNSFDGWAIDDFAITAPPIPKDAGVIAIVTPAGSTTTGSSVTVQVTLENFGTDTLMSIPVAYTVNGGTQTQQTWTGNLASGATTNFTFTTTYVSPGTDYTLCAFTKRTGDFYHFNDTTCEGLTATPAAIDAGVTAVLAPGDTTNPGDSIQVRVRIRNFGTTTLTTTPVAYTRNGVVVATETWTGSLAYNDSADYTFVQKFVSPLSNYILCGYTILPGDANPLNDQSCIYPVGVVGMNEYAGDAFMLWQNVPNPANGTTRIEYYVPYSDNAVFELRDVLGRLMKTIELNPVVGLNYLELDVKSIPTGVYYYTLSFDGQQLSKKMVVTK